MTSRRIVSPSIGPAATWVRARRVDAESHRRTTSIPFSECMACYQVRRAGLAKLNRLID